ncbi:MAG: hypothetical protein DRI95_00720 [Bacteroidetes bacterium]|nr:MAG: hypothetical protein DRI95_00720 [Bacteroidota bacterium]
MDKMDKIENLIHSLISECNLNNVSIPIFKKENENTIIFFSSKHTSIELINRLINNITDNYIIIQINTITITIKIL